MTISEERKKRVIDLYHNQGKTMREIAKIERMSIRDISAIIKEEEARRLQHKQQQHQEEISSKAYKLFAEGKRPVDVAIALNIREPEATKLFIEYCKLKRLHQFYLAYRELGDEGIGYFVKLCKLAMKEGYSREQVLNLLQLADEDNPFGLPQLEKRHKWLIEKIHDSDMQIEGAKNYLHTLNNEIAGAKYSLDYCRDAYERTRQELQRLYEEKNKLESLQRENNGNIAE